jgi:hypothetical protein
MTFTVIDDGGNRDDVKSKDKTKQGDPHFHNQY